MKTINVILILLIIVCLGIIVFLLTKVPKQDAQPNLAAPTNVATENPPESTDAPQPTETVEVPEQTEPETVENDTEQVDMIWIQTPYIDLGYPAQWESYLRCEPKEENGVFTQSFLCSVNSEKVPLFDVHMGSEAVGEPMGYINTADGKVVVSMTFHDYAPDSTWSQDDTYVLYAMQESVNELMRSLRENENFSKE